LSTLISAVRADLSGVRTWAEFAGCLHEFHRRSGLSLMDLERAGRQQAQRNGQFRELKRSTLSDVLNGKRRAPKALLQTLLAAWNLPDAEQAAWLDAWHRTLDDHRRPAGARRFDEMSPRELGIHAAITTPDAPGGLPTYVRRDFDDDLRRTIAAGAEDGCFVVLVGGSSTGKTRSLYEAILDEVPNWWLRLPTDTQAVLDLLGAPPERTVLWLDELDRYLGTSPPLTKECVCALVRDKMIVVGTLWPDEFAARKAMHRYDENRRLLDFAHVISVVADLSPAEQSRAACIAEGDSRIRIALDTKDAGLTQVLAAGPDLVLRWEQAEPYTKAVITAAADARRLGIHRPLSPDLLTEAMFDYLPPPHRVAPSTAWWEPATSEAMTPLHDAVAALSPVDGGSPGTLAGYVVADYLAQHARRTRRTECPPHSAWQALVDHIEDPDDLRRLAVSARTRLRYRYLEQILRRLAAVADDESAAPELADLLIRQDRIDEATALLRQRLRLCPGDSAAAKHLAEIDALLVRAAELRRSAATPEPFADQRLAELLADRGKADELRTGADVGDHVAADHLAELLADRGCLRELRDRADNGHRFAADLLADLLLARGQLEALRERAQAGDEAAALRLALGPDGHGNADGDSQARIAEMRFHLDAGDEKVPSQLVALLFELGNESELRLEVDAGTHEAAERLIALLTADEVVDAEQVSRIRAFGLNADGSGYDPGAPR
jgi:hypothetical protein